MAATSSGCMLPLLGGNFPGGSCLRPLALYAGNGSQTQGAPATLYQDAVSSINKVPEVCRWPWLGA